jgi:hypothetical protein
VLSCRRPDNAQRRYTYITIPKNAANQTPRSVRAVYVHIGGQKFVWDVPALTLIPTPTRCAAGVEAAEKGIKSRTSPSTVEAAGYRAADGELIKLIQRR